jgi:hypothetical protein
MRKTSHPGTGDQVAEFGYGADEPLLVTGAVQAR